MISRYIVPLLAVIGIVFAVLYTTVLSNPPPPPPQQLSVPMANPYAAAISGSGIVEANTRNITIGSELSGVVTGVDVEVGAEIKKGTPLFRLDDRATSADILVKQKDLAAAEASLNKAKAKLAEDQDQLRRTSNLKPGLSVSGERLEQLQLVVKTSEAEVKVAAAQVEATRAQLNATKVTLDRLIVRAPIDGKILQVNIKAGEFVNAGSDRAVPIVMGNVSPLYVRVSVDENDLWRLQANSHAVGALRGNRDIEFPLKFIRVEPFVIPKRSLTGETSERVDTRVLDVIYELTDQTIPVYVGQQIDVFISSAQTKPAEKP
jgi:HlyD family secretion protein